MRELQEELSQQGEETSRRKSSTEETWHGKYAEENNLVQNHLKYTYMLWGLHRSSPKAATGSKAHPRAWLESAQDPFPSVARIRGRWQGLSFSHLSQVLQAYSPDVFCNTHLLQYSLDVVYLHTSEQLPGLSLQLHDCNSLSLLPLLCRMYFEFNILGGHWRSW